MNESFLNTAIIFAHKVHINEKDKAGLPYILHPMAVSEMLDNPIDKAIGVLHDVVESNPNSLDELISIGAPKEVIEALKLLTRDKNDTYEEYINKIIESKNIRAIRVKLKDISHNTSVDRMANLDPIKMKSLSKRYAKAERVLIPALEELQKQENK